FIDDLRHLSPQAIIRNFPRDEKGRLQVDCMALLAMYQSAVELPRMRELWLAAVGPARRSDPQVVTVKLDLQISENHPHNWSRLRWWWDRRHEWRSEKERWDITSAELRTNTGERRKRRNGAWANWKSNGGQKRSIPPSKFSLRPHFKTPGGSRMLCVSAGSGFPRKSPAS